MVGKIILLLFITQCVYVNSQLGDVVNAAKDAVGVGDEENEEDEEKEVCFGALGCFSMDSPWKTLLRPLPAPFHPKNISTRLYYYSRPNTKQRQYVHLYPEISLRETSFDSSKPTVFITHGFSSNGNSSWLEDMKNAYLKQVDANVFLVDWGQGASLFNYLQVASNTRVVGRELARFGRHLVEREGANPSNFHLVGHSLGAQISSYFAKEVPGIGRLTALDPAQPGFEGYDKQVRLDESDAKFVDVIHTDARPLVPLLGLGMMGSYGHVDFYMNGGFEQPGCIVPAKDKLPVVNNLLDLAKYPVEIIAQAVTCPHGRSYEYFTEALNDTNSCIFWGHKASAPAVAKSITNTVTQGLLTKLVALSSSCSRDDCTPLGLTTIASALRGSVVATTQPRRPYCVSEPGIPPETEGKEESTSSLGERLTQPGSWFIMFIVTLNVMRLT